jgi:hypothetical protein
VVLSELSRPLNDQAAATHFSDLSRLPMVRKPGNLVSELAWPLAIAMAWSQLGCPLDDRPSAAAGICHLASDTLTGVMAPLFGTDQFPQVVGL